jgi:hypothetical protein
MLRKVALHEALAVLVLAAAVGNAETPEPGDKTAPVTTGAVASTVAATGNLDAPRTVGVTFNGNPGLVTKLGVRVGDEVEAGQELAEVDKRPATRQLQLSRPGVSWPSRRRPWTGTAPRLPRRSAPSATPWAQCATRRCSCTSIETRTTT